MLTVPFEGADDAARLTYETSMCKQAKALVKSDIPYVSTSAFYDAPNISPYFRIQAEYDGVIKSAYNGGVSILYDGFDEPTYYSYETLESGTSSVILRAAVIEEGQRVKAGETLVTSNFVEDGVMTTGVNVLIAYVPKGANYEDGVYMSERLAQKMVSYHPKRDTIVIPKEFKSWNGHSPKKTLFLHPGDQIMNISGMCKGEHMVEVLRSKKIKGFLVDWHRDVGGFENKSDVVVLNSVFIAPANRGDKTANRHGNKGVAPEIKTNSKMLELSNGEFIDMCYNPMGVKELEQTYYGDKDAKPNPVYATKAPAIGNQTLEIATECLVVPLDTNGVPEWNKAEVASLPLTSNTKIQQLRAIYTNTDFCDDEQEYLEVSWNYSGTTKAEAGRSACFTGVSKETSLARKFPELWEANKGKLADISLDPETIASKNWTLSTATPVKEVVEKFKSYLLKRPILFPHIDFDADITKAAAKDIIDLGVTAEYKNIQEQLLALVNEDATADDSGMEVSSEVVEKTMNLNNLEDVQKSGVNVDDVADQTDIDNL